MIGDETGALAFETVELDDDVSLAACVNPDGSVTYWLLVAGGDDDDQGCADCATHERTGWLPREWQRKVDAIGRCGAPTASGDACLNHPAKGGSGRCAQHTKTTDATGENAR